MQGVFDGREDSPRRPVEESEATCSHRLAYLGWDDAPDMATLAAGNGGSTLLVKRCGIDQARPVKSQAWKVCDGENRTHPVHLLMGFAVTRRKTPLGLTSRSLLSLFPLMFLHRRLW